MENSDDLCENYLDEIENMGDELLNEINDNNEEMENIYDYLYEDELEEIENIYGEDYVKNEQINEERWEHRWIFDEDLKIFKSKREIIQKSEERKKYEEAIRSKFVKLDFTHQLSSLFCQMNELVLPAIKVENVGGVLSLPLLSSQMQQIFNHYPHSTPGYYYFFFIFSFILIEL